MPRVTVLLTALLAATMLVGCGGDEPAPVADPASPATPAEPGDDDGEPGTGDAPLPLEAGGADRVLADMRARLGYEPQYAEINLYDTYAILEARDRDRPNNVDRYVWRTGTLDDPEPVRIRREEVPGVVFNAEGVRLSRVPALVARGEQLDIEAPRVCCVLIQRWGSGGEIRMTVSVTGTRESATLIADARGRVQRVVR